MSYPISSASIPAGAGIAPAAKPAPRWSVAAWALLMAPVCVYLLSLWFVRPVPTSLVSPVILFITPLAFAISRRYLFRELSRVGFEFGLLGIMLVLSLFSIINHNEPFRSLRIIIPCLVPLAIFMNFVVIGSISPGRLLTIPRLLIAACFVMSVGPFFLSLVFPPVEGLLYGSYRLKCFFENPIQYAIGLAVVIPLATAEFAIAKRTLHKIGWGILLLALAFTMFRTGSKTPMAVCCSISGLMYVTLKIGGQSIGRSILTLAMLAGIVVVMLTHGLDFAEKVEPEIGGKIRSIVEGGVSNYHSIKERKLLWSEAIAQGRAHWIVGSGAGERVRGFTHSHNLVLDYFKGIGIFGATAIVLLCLAIFYRPVVMWFRVIAGGAGRDEARVWACYVAAAIYVICNQMSDSFGPSTIGFLWVVYLCGVLSAPRARASSCVETMRRPRRGSRVAAAFRGPLPR